MKTRRRHTEERFFQLLMIGSFLIVIGSLAAILATVLIRGLPALNLAMLTQVPQGGYYLGKEGGVLNAITGSIALAGGATVLSFGLGLTVVLYFHIFATNSRWVNLARLAFDVLWGVPSIVYGAFGFTLMILLGMRASLLGGMIALTFIELPILVRAMDEVVAMVPGELKEASYAVGSTGLETAVKVILRQTMPGLMTALLLGFGRGIGDAASVLFTAGYTDRLPSSLLRPVASLPLAVFFQLGSPVPQVQDRAYASALILTGIILCISLTMRLLTRRMKKHVVR